MDVCCLGIGVKQDNKAAILATLSAARPTTAVRPYSKRSVFLMACYKCVGMVDHNVIHSAFTLILHALASQLLHTFEALVINSDIAAKSEGSLPG